MVDERRKGAKDRRCPDRKEQVLMMAILTFTMGVGYYFGANKAVEPVVQHQVKMCVSQCEALQGLKSITSETCECRSGATYPTHP